MELKNKHKKVGAHITVAQTLKKDPQNRQGQKCKVKRILLQKDGCQYVEVEFKDKKTALYDGWECFVPVYRKIRKPK